MSSVVAFVPVVVPSEERPAAAVAGAGAAAAVFGLVVVLASASTAGTELPRVPVVTSAVVVAEAADVPVRARLLLFKVVVVEFASGVGPA